MTKPSIEPLPRLLVDTREQTPLVFNHLQSAPAALQSGDYSARGLEDVFAVERKSLADLVGSLKSGRDRFMRELHRLRGFTFARLLVVGSMQELYTMRQRGRVNLDQVEHSLLSIEQRYGVPVVRVDTPAAGALMVETWAFTAWRDAAAKMGVKLPFPDWCAGVLTGARPTPQAATVEEMAEAMKRSAGLPMEPQRLNRPATVKEILRHASDEYMPC